LKLNVKPRISLSPDDDPVNDTIQLGIVITINDFMDATFTSQDASAGNVFKREVQTSAHVRNREVIPIGGLLRRESAQSATETPLLGRIPIIGYFFKNRGGTTADTNLTIFLCPTVVRPRLRRGGVDRYTRDYVKLTKKYAQEGMLFDTLKDPVTRWFFKTESEVVDTVNDFLSDDEFKREKEVRILSKRSKEREAARHARTAKELEYEEMQAKDQNVAEQNLEEKIAMPSGVIQAEPRASKVMQEACNKEAMQVASQETNKAFDKETRLKELIQNEENPLETCIAA
jgi:hypothetical protein